MNMPLYLKRITKTGTEMFLMYPGSDLRTPFKRRSLTFLMDNCSRENVEREIDRLELKKFALEKQLILCFPVPTTPLWRGMNMDDVASLIQECQDNMTKPDDLPLTRNAIGIPTLEAMTSTWHPMNDTKFLIGTGTGASAVMTMAALHPANIAGIVAEGGTLLDMLHLTHSPMPACLLGVSPIAQSYFTHANGCQVQQVMGGFSTYSSSINPLQRTFISNDSLTADILHRAYTLALEPVRRTNTCPNGDIEPSMDLEAVGMDKYIENTRLPDGIPHTWFVHVPTAFRRECKINLPMVFFMHGGSDNPQEAAEMSKWHEVGERESFITVYPWGTNRCGWNSAMEDDLEDDVGFLSMLIDFMIDNYPVDKGRVYMSGFSNGAAMAQSVALTHPEKVAALCHIDSNWPGDYNGFRSVTEEDITPFRIGFEKKKEYDYLMPVWYTYGSRERAFPIYRASTQQNQYDLWKKYNHISITPTPEKGEPNPTGCGADTPDRELIYPSQRHPNHFYQLLHFHDAQGRNLYNLAIMHDKGHEVAEMDASLAWNYVKHYRRNPDGSITRE